ncbi:nucleotidyl transferase AbiEii/AbiGii toxin family protein [Streptomyces sp. ITFR-16]|uniref:nucleotidyl transferase AbiEii/AbiGii toxin family protein n=1 Tax=Streptomyces sp. ITFR-16 TaxID=3075198 RepID=UPI00288BB841|nr:nucleotidyl transferase AbiEii/AbiGii toxin family protein [Streptomyces sp. ITFR-16]WNI20618.1 nucleotidyl transferase AbiEii/AbiGii toxin family protein [Streptomyces sp. ITFR-16]
MTSSADDATWDGLWHRSPYVPHSPLSERTRRPDDLPRTLLPSPPGLRRPVVFDPALKQYADAYRAGEPRFDDPGAARAWHRARRTALDTVLAAVAAGPWADHLVLRGSVLMATWFGESARDPGDLDFVVVPQDWAMDSPRTESLFETVARDARTAACGPVRIDAAGLVTEDIWTYERVPGRRMVLPWTAPGIPGGTVQVDVVFNEALPQPPVRTRLRPLGDGPGCRVLAASPGLSLAWKLLWLVSDAYPQGKDLYDAVLLAEHTPPRYDTVRAAFALAGADGLRPAGRWWIETLGVETGWEHFVADYPWVTDTAAGLTRRLGRALEPMLAEAEPPGETPYDRWARWLAPLVAVTRERAPADPASVLGHLAGGGFEGLAAAVVVVREVCGPERVSERDALAAVLAREDNWRYWRENPQYCRRALELLR